MVQKSAKAAARRGRPRAYDPEKALARATAVFWDAGFAATSLDDLADATAMNRPSLYAAFGDKQALYLKALEGYKETARAGMGETLRSGRPLRETLQEFYRRALDMYFAGGAHPRGCFMIGTALTSAVQDETVRESLKAGLDELDRALAARFRRAQADGEIAADADPAMLGRLASAVLYFLAIRSRAGEPRAALEATAAAGITLLCSEPPRRRKAATSRR